MRYLIGIAFVLMGLSIIIARRTFAEGNVEVSRVYSFARLFGRIGHEPSLRLRIIVILIGGVLLIVLGILFIVALPIPN